MESLRSGKWAVMYDWDGSGRAREGGEDRKREREREDRVTSKLG